MILTAWASAHATASAVRSRTPHEANARFPVFAARKTRRFPWSIIRSEGIEERRVPVSQATAATAAAAWT